MSAILAVFFHCCFHCHLRSTPKYRLHACRACLPKRAPRARASESGVFGRLVIAGPVPSARRRLAFAVSRLLDPVILQLHRRCAPSGKPADRRLATRSMTLALTEVANRFNAQAFSPHWGAHHPLAGTQPNDPGLSAMPVLAPPPALDGLARPRALALSADCRAALDEARAGSHGID